MIQSSEFRERLKDAEQLTFISYITHEVFDPLLCQNVD